MATETRQPGRIAPTRIGNTADALIELADQHTLAFREAVLLISSFMRMGYEFDRTGFFADLRRMVDEWERDETVPWANDILNPKTPS